MRRRYVVIENGSVGRRHHKNIEMLGAESTLLPWSGLDVCSLQRRLLGAAGAVIATATDVRLEIVQLCASLDTAVYVEKPLAFLRAGLDSILKAAKPVIDRSVAGFMMRNHPAFKTSAQDPLKAFRFRIEIGHDVRQWRQHWSLSDSYVSCPCGGGAPLDPCHEIDTATWPFPGLELGEVARIGHLRSPGGDFATRIRLRREGLTRDVAMDRLSPKSIRRLSVPGCNGGVDLDPVSGREVRWQGAKEARRDWKTKHSMMLLNQMPDFMALAEVRKPSGNPLSPPLDLIEDSLALFARAWNARRFHVETEWGNT
ncbi:MAG: hypothetical protein F4Y60_01625 [Boseongicola sp. SB0664_bin_43]|uniref:Gfo/Idh/MocA-like oxidoreductase N-terminal domain-containing protein n=1 Tax=Boseongicola sp. SB0664_bin_43 TaxID=2604844 RepID=A0A6B0XYR9_9RHOB|nr:hypothetical protein [Boseongicola sp. SB0664_bin_43]MYK30658.1 hypothetical protein [Boseongicola sp. SB0670_bin_30]